MTSHKFVFVLLVSMIVVGLGGNTARAEDAPKGNKGFTASKTTVVDLGPEIDGMAGRQLRMRMLTIEPGGIVPWHSHDDRPALIFVQQGEIVEYASNCVDPIVHKVGDIRPEIFGTSHWWKNLGKETVILYVGDVRKDPHDHNM